MNTDNWKWFKYSELFTIKKGKRLTKNDMIDGNIKYIGAVDSNNGITAYISNDEHIHSAGTITVSYNGSIAEAYYQTEPFWATDDVNVLYPKFELNKYIALFLCTLISKEKYRFNYGRKWNKEMMLKSVIKLPVTKQNTPDWQWIEDYVKNTLIPKLPQRAKDVWNNNFDTTPLSNKKIKLNTDKWQWFSLSSLFTVELSKGDIKYNLCQKGGVPLISAGESNNGTVGYIDTFGDGVAEMFDDNKLTTDMFCNSFYQPQMFYAVSHGRVNILTPLFDMNKYHALFISTLIAKEKYRFSYGRAVYSNETGNLKIKLPVTKNGKPDWKFMENYIKSLPYSKII
ncbi:MAG: restriction endonuclease subunit S [Bacteroidales bacterium]|nr:restriction endonuclease subunit S [Bacteroidales bacterium]